METGLFACGCIMVASLIGLIISMVTGNTGKDDKSFHNSIAGARIAMVFYMYSGILVVILAIAILVKRIIF